MILGNGLIATSLSKNLKNHTNLLIFASGVSNSKEEREEEYEREFQLLKQTINEHKDKKLIYFSSCSIDSINPSRYNEHKKFIEKYIQDNLNNYLILRLPNVIGNSTNKNQLVNYFYDCLINQIKVTVNTDCIRHLIDVDDLSKVIELLDNIESTTLNVAFGNGVNVDEIIYILESVVGTKFKNIEFIQKGNDYTIDNISFLQHIDETNFTTNPKKIIQKYFKNEH